MGLWNDIKRSFTKGNYLTRLIYINSAVYLAILILYATGFLMNNPVLQEKIINQLAVPASLRTILLKPWTIITYMFTHKDIWHILFNMLWLYWFGKIFLEYLDQKKLVSVYILGGISGAVVYVLSYNVFPVFSDQLTQSIAIGASASVMAIVIAIAAYVPDYTINLLILGRVRIIYLALGIFVLTSFMEFQENTGGKLAHIGGAAFGYLYILNMRRGRDMGKGINRIIDTIATFLKPGKKMKVTYKKNVTDYEYNKTRSERQAKINLILDKISKGGYDSLTKEEKEMLFSESQKKN